MRRIFTTWLLVGASALLFRCDMFWHSESFPNKNGCKSPWKKKQRSPQIGFWMTKASFLQAPLKYHLNKCTADLSLKRILASQIGFPSNPLIFQGFVSPVTVVSAHCRLMTPFFQAASWMSYSSSLSCHESRGVYETCILGCWCYIIIIYITIDVVCCVLCRS